jgi:hypothetical protein
MVASSAQIGTTHSTLSTPSSTSSNECATVLHIIKVDKVLDSNIIKVDKVLDSRD